PDKRREYDNMRKYGTRGGEFTPPPGWNPGGGGAYESAGFGDAEGFSEFFAAMFGRGGVRRGGFGDGGMRGMGGNAPMLRRGEDAHVELPLFHEDAYRGTDKTVELRVPEIDEHGRRIQRTRKLKIKTPAGSADGGVLRIKGQ